MSLGLSGTFWHSLLVYGQCRVLPSRRLKIQSIEKHVKSIISLFMHLCTKTRDDSTKRQ